MLHGCRLVVQCKPRREPICFHFARVLDEYLIINAYLRLFILVHTVRVSDLGFDMPPFMEAEAPVSRKISAFVGLT